MSEIATRRDDVRERILAEPDVILEDPDVMRALVLANEKALGSNIVDLRGIAMERLEARLGRLEDAHKGVVAAAYENLAGTNQIHRAVLRMLEPVTFEEFLLDLGGAVAEILRVDAACLILESDTPEQDGAVAGLIELKPVGFVAEYVTRGRDLPLRPVTLRQIDADERGIYGRRSDWMRSEACLVLNFGEGRLPGLLALGAEDPHTFAPTQGTDLLTFFGGAVERAMRRWIA